MLNIQQLLQAAEYIERRERGENYLNFNLIVSVLLVESFAT